MTNQTGLKIQSAGADAAVKEILHQLQADGGDEGLTLRLLPGEAPGLSVKREGDVLSVAYSERAYLFRGLGLAVEHGTEKNLALEQTSVFEGNGLMLDCSRNAVPTLATVKDMIRQLALMGHNTLMLYTEDTYELEDEPYFGYMRGRYTREELRELDAYAADFGIEMVPCIQTLAHLPCALRWNAYRDVKDIDDILTADYGKTYALIEKMIRACREAFRSRRIHIGMDEAMNLGRGKYKNLYGDTPSIDIMCRHLEKVTALCRQYDFKPMLWNDMFFTLAGDGYCPQEGIDASLLNRAPSDVSMVYWDYYANRQSVYDDNFRKQISLPNELIFAGGAWKWSGYAPGLYYSLKVSRLALDACRRYGVKRIFTTAWGDNGSDASLYSMMPVVQLFAELGFNPGITEEELASRFAVCTGGDWADFLKLDLPDFVEGDPEWAACNPSKYLLFNDPMTGLFDRHADESFDAYYEKTAAALSEAAAKGGRYAYLFDALAALCDTLSLKASVGVRLKKAYDGGDRAELRRLADEVLPEIARRADRFLRCVETQWMKESKGFGFEVQDIRIAGVASRARSAARRVSAYLNGEAAALEELEAERLYFDCREDDGERKITACNNWALNVSGAVI